MSNISGYLDLLNQKIDQKRNLKKLIRNEIVSILDFDIQEDCILISNTVCYLKIKPLLKQEVLFKKEIILNQLNKFGIHKIDFN